MQKKYTIITLLVDILYDVMGSILFSIGLNSFAVPKEIAPGGVSGIAVMVNALFGVPLGVVTMTVNIPLLLLAWHFLGRKFAVKTLKSVFILSMVMDLVAPLVPIYTGDYILAALLGGVLMGAGLGIIFTRGSTTGGTDIISRLIQHRFRHIPIGKTMMGVDVVILATSIFVFHNIEAGLYGLISIFTSTRVIDSILFGLNTGKMVLIISNQEKKISRSILDDLGRGVTFLKAEGAYSGRLKDIMLCAVRPHEYHRLAELVRELDPNAFIIAAEASEILGEGFRYITEEKVT